MTHEFKASQRVACYWYDGRFTGTIKEVHGSKVLVLFDSGQQKWTNPKQLRRLKPKKSKREWTGKWMKSADAQKFGYHLVFAPKMHVNDADIGVEMTLKQSTPSTPRKGKFVTRELLAKAWDEALIGRHGVANPSETSDYFPKFCTALGLDEVKS